MVSIVDPTGGGTLTLNANNIPAGQDLQILGPLYLAASATSLTSALTAGDAAITSGPSLVLTQPGRYILTAIISTDFSGATYAANQVATMHLQRTNNTPAAVADSSETVMLPVMTTATLAGPTVTIGPVFYTTSNTDDALSVYALLSATPSVGSVRVTGARIMATRY